MKTPWTTGPALVLAALLGVACGGDDDTKSAAGTSDGQAAAAKAAPAGPVPLTGTYVVDAERMRRQAAEKLGLDPDEAPPPASNFTVQDYRMVIATDGTFTLLAGMEEFAFSTAGTWTRVGADLELVTTTVNGEPAPEEVSGVTDRLRIEPGALVLEQGDTRIFLRREPDEPAAPREGEAGGG